jgi:hypothetical protein
MTTSQPTEAQRIAQQRDEQIASLALLGPDTLATMIAECAPRTKYISTLRLARLRALSA